MVTHELKTKPEYFERTIRGDKDFEVRYNDRDFQSGDMIVLREYDENNAVFTGRQKKGIIKYILHSFPGLNDNYVVLGINYKRHYKMVI